MLLLIGIVVGLATFALTLALQRSAEANRLVVQGRMATASTTGITAFIPLPRLQTMSERAQRVRTKLDRAGVNLTVSEYTTVRVIFAVVGAILLMLAAGRLEFGFTIGAIL